jgi:hypothetical protein
MVAPAALDLPAGPVADAQEPATGPGLPTPRTAAALVLGVLACGVVLGHSAGPGATAADAGGRPNLTILAAAPQPLATPPAAPVAPVPPAGGTSSADLRSSGDTSSPPADSGASPVPSSADTSAPTTPAGTGSTPTTDTSGSSGVGTGTDTSATPAPKLPPVKHVWVVALTGHSWPETFGATGPDAAAPYLTQELRARGALLPWYHAAGHDPSAGGVALLGGQKDAVGPFEATTKTLADQLTGAGRTWRAYVEGASDGLAPGDNPCARPPEQQPRNPFLRFKSVTGDSSCGSLLADLPQLATDAATTDSAPAFSYILPGPAHDGSSSLADADAWLRTTLEPLLASKAYADGGLVVVTFDAGAADDAEAGGGRVGALLLSPFVTPGATIQAPHDPFSLLHSIENLFGLEPLGYAKDTRLKAFGRKVYAAWTPTAS